MSKRRLKALLWICLLTMLAACQQDDVMNAYNHMSCADLPHACSTSK